MFIYFQREGKGRREGEKHQSVASRAPPTGDVAHNLGMCPDRESNLQPFSLQASAQSIEPYQLGLFVGFNFLKIIQFSLYREACF